ILERHTPCRVLTMNVLVINSGSSSLKFQVISTDLERIKQFKEGRLCRGEVEGIGGEAIIKFKNRQAESQKFTAPLRDVSAALDYLVRFIASDRSGVTEIKNTADVKPKGKRVWYSRAGFSEASHTS